jgi:hypothetical protein
MSDILTAETLNALGIRYAVLGVRGYALPVRFRVRGAFVECGVPTWSGIGELPEKAEQVTLTAVTSSGDDLYWLFIRGPGYVINDPDWEGLVPYERSLVDPGDLYRLLQIEPLRIELFDEKRGWGYRETADLTAIHKNEDDESGI